MAKLLLLPLFFLFKLISIKVKYNLEIEKKQKILVAFSDE